MKKWFLILMSVLLALPVFGSPVLADEAVSLEDGRYTIEFEVLYEGSDQFNGLFKKPATLLVENGEPKIVEIEYAGMEPYRNMEMTPGEIIEVKDIDGTNGLIRMNVEGVLTEPLTLLLENFNNEGRPHHLDLTFDSNTIKPLNENGNGESNTVEDNDGENGTTDNNNEGITNTDENGNDEQNNPDNENVNNNTYGDNSNEGEEETTEEGNQNEVDPSLIPNEAYTINYESDKDLARHFKNPVTFLIKDGKQYIQIAGSGAQFIDSLTINDEEVTWSEINEDNSYTIQFEINSLEEKLKFDMYLTTPMGEMHHEAQLWFDESTKEEVDVNNFRLIETEEEPNGADSSLVPDEAYTVNYESNKDLARHFKNPVALLVKDGKLFIQISGSGAQFIDSLTINDEEVTWGEINEDGTYTIQFEINSLDEVLKFDMYLTTPMGEMHHEAQLWFDESTKAEVDVKDYLLIETEVEPEEPRDPTNNPSNGETPSNKDDNGDGNQTSNKDKQNDEVTTPKDQAEEAHRIKFVIMKENEDVLSAADQFFEDYGILLNKDGQYFVQIITKPNSGQFINSFRSKISDKYYDMILVDETADGRKIFQFKVDGELSDVIYIDMRITVPGIYDNEYYKARIFLDPNTMEEVSAEDYKLLLSETNPNGYSENPTTPQGGSKDTEKPDKPEFGNGEDKNGDNNKDAKKDGLNPKTGENTNVMLYLLLLIASAIPLAIQVKRRFV